MRDAYRTTIAQAQADGTLKGLAGVEVKAYLVGTLTEVTVYQDRTGGATGPSPYTGGVANGVNGMTTAAGGAVEFWLPAGVYDIHVRDSIVPARVAQRGFGGANAPIQWNSMPASAGAIPTTVLAADGLLGYGALGDDVKRQHMQIGQVIDWWRPIATVPLPAGFEICDGRQILAGNHEFPGVGNINLPDLRNKFVIGADVYKTDGTASSNGDGTATAGPTQHPNAPGIGGSGGSNTSKNLDHQHVVPGHKHTVSDPGHGHSANSSGTGVSTGAAGSHNHTIWVVNNGGGSGNFYLQHVLGSQMRQDSMAGSDAVGNHTHGISDPGHSHSINSSGTGITVGPGGAPNGDSAQATTGTNLSTSVDMRPQHVGLLKLMKVRRA